MLLAPPVPIDGDVGGGDGWNEGYQAVDVYLDV
jgi:hypothetical protein